MQRGEKNMEQERIGQERNLAWFKLADLISRGEREKALNVFRLLSHSLNNRAYVLQIEGDILWYLDDKSAIDRYKQAAFLYQKEKRWIDAIAIYEHILTQDATSYEALVSLMMFYTMVDWQDRLDARFVNLLSLFSQKIITEETLEQAIKEIIQLVKDIDVTTKNAWFFPWIDHALQSLPSSMQARLSQEL